MLTIKLKLDGRVKVMNIIFVVKRIWRLELHLDYRSKKIYLP
jgi:hypothetical protein